MGKNFTTENRILKLTDQENEKAKVATSTFYPDGTIANFTLSSAKQPLATLLTLAKQPPAPQAMTREQLLDTCMNTRINVKQGKPGNIEIQFNMGRQISDKQILPLGNTVVKVLPMDSNQPAYLFIKAGDTLDAHVFLGDGNIPGVMAIEDENGEECFLPLAEFHLLSLREDPDPRKEIGLMTSYLWLTSKVYSSIIFAASLDPIKNLLLSEWLQAEWQRAKDAAANPPSEPEGVN